MRNLTIKQLRTIIAVCKHGKISSAAADLGLTASAVTIQIQHLEQEIGLPVFDRSKSGVVATETGKLILEAAYSVQEQIRSLSEKVESIKGLETGLLRLGVTSTGKYFAPSLIAAFKELHPGIKTRLFVGNRADIIDNLRNYEIDVALMGQPPEDLEFKSTVFGDHPIVFIACPQHPLGKTIDITRTDLMGEQFLNREPGSGTRRLFEHFMKDHLRPQEDNVSEMGSNETIKQAVMADLGIALISGHTIEQELKTGRLIVLDVMGTPIRRYWHCVMRKSSVTVPALEAFERFLFEKAGSHLPILGRTYPAQSLEEAVSQ